MNISSRRIQQIIKEIKILYKPSKLKHKAGKIDEIEFFIHYIKLIEEKNKKAKSRNDDYLKAQTRLRLAQAERAELENAKENKSLVPKEISINFISNIFGNLRNKLLGARYRMAFGIFSSKNLKQAQLITKKIVNEILNELSDPKTLYKKHK